MAIRRQVRCELVPWRRANMLPSVVDGDRARPSASHCALNQSRTARSASLSVSRHRPPFGVAPNRAVFISVSHSRLPSMVRFSIGFDPLLAQSSGDG